jgi:hypothetical protein
MNEQVGTTFLQSSLSSPALTTVLLQDNYVYLGKCPHSRTCPLPTPKDCKGIVDSLIAASSLSETTATLTPTTSGTLNQNRPTTSASHDWSNQTLLLAAQQELLRTHNIDYRRNALLVDENLVLDDPAIASILTSMYRVRVVLGYRRLYEWLVSEYNQVFKPWGSYKTAAYNWPSDDEQGGGTGGQALLPFDVEDRGVFSKRFEYFKETGRHPTQILRDEAFFADVHIINHHGLLSQYHDHNIDPLLHHFVCDTMNATKSCHAIKKGLRPSGEETRNNSGMDFDYDRLAMAAFERGWINITSSDKKSKNNRAQVVQRVMEYDSNNNAAYQGRMPISDYPHDCLGNEKLDMVRVVSPTDYSVNRSRNEIAHRNLIAFSSLVLVVFAFF